MTTALWYKVKRLAESILVITLIFETTLFQFRSIAWFMSLQNTIPRIFISDISVFKSGIGQVVRSFQAPNPKILVFFSIYLNPTGHTKVIKNIKNKYKTQVAIYKKGSVICKAKHFNASTWNIKC